MVRFDWFFAKTNQVAVGSIRVFSKLGCVFIKV